MLLIQALSKLGEIVRESIVLLFFLDSSGKQKRGAIISFFGFYLFGIPLAGVLMFFVRIDIYGFWIGIIAAETVTNALLFILVQRFNWESHAKSALKRISFNPKNATAMISTVSTIDEKSQQLIQDSTDQTKWIKSLRIKLLILSLFICFLIAGIVTSTMIPL
jgi:hypothetical protein